MLRVYHNHDSVVPAHLLLLPAHFMPSLYWCWHAIVDDSKLFITLFSSPYETRLWGFMTNLTLPWIWCSSAALPSFIVPNQGSKLVFFFWCNGGGKEKVFYSFCSLLLKQYLPYSCHHVWLRGWWLPGHVIFLGWSLRLLKVVFLWFLVVCSIS